MNERDSEIVCGELRQRGFTLVEDEEQADVILYNTCSVRQHAEERVFSNVGQLKQLKARRPEVIIGIIGCMAQAYQGKLLDRLPHIDLIAGPGNLREIPQLVEQLIMQRSLCSDVTLPGGAGRPSIIAVEGVPQARMTQAWQAESDFRRKALVAYLTIIEGCNKHCSFCIVPTTRGRERSRPIPDILEEVQALADQGYQEITLLGQNVNSYGHDLAPRACLADLLCAIDQTRLVNRVRFTTNHPRDAQQDLFQAMRDCASVCEHLHLPVQSGSNRILKQMYRGYSREVFLEKVQQYREMVPDGSLTTDIIVGFPTETDEDHVLTRELMERVRFDDAFIFNFSPRTGTKAADWPDDVPSSVKEARLQGLLTLQRQHTLERNRHLIGTVQEVLVEDRAKRPMGSDQVLGSDLRHPNLHPTGGLTPARQDLTPLTLTGRTRTHKKTVFLGSERLIGEIVAVNITGAEEQTLIGEMVVNEGRRRSKYA